MRFTKIWVDMVLASCDEFIVRYEWQTPRYRHHDGTVRGGGKTHVSSPVYARAVSSKSIQMYDITNGSISKAGNGVASKTLMDFTHAVFQSDLIASTSALVPVVP